MTTRLTRWLQSLVPIGGIVLVSVLLAFGTAKDACRSTRSSVLSVCDITSASLQPGTTMWSTGQYRSRSLDRPAAILALLLLCQRHGREGHLERALELCSQAIGLNPSNPGGYKLRGEVWLRLNDRPRAIADFEQSLRLDPLDPETYADRGETLRRGGDLDRAEDDFGKAIALAPDESRFWNARCWLRAVSGRVLTAAADDCTNAIARDRNAEKAFAGRGLVRVKLARYPAAIEDFDFAIDLKTDYAFALFGRGIAKLHLRRIRSGQADITRARSFDRDIDRTFASVGIWPRGLALPPRVAPHKTPRCKDGICVKSRKLIDQRPAATIRSAANTQR